MRRVNAEETTGSKTGLAHVCVLAWCGVTLLVPLSLALAYALRGASGPDLLVQNGPGSTMPLTLLSVALAWLLLGVVVFGARLGYVNRVNAVSWAGFCTVALLYLNVLRERAFYGDWHDYYLAAVNLQNGEHLHPRYLYPPFWATLLSPISQFGAVAVFYVCWLANVVGLVLFYVLIHKALQRYGFSNRLAAVVTTAFLLVNTPVLRTLFYTQVNLHVINAILLSIVLYPKNRVLSAVAMSLAVHLKASPIILVVAFLLERDFRWLAWFALSSLALAGVTVALYGVSPFQDWIFNASHIYGANLLAYRENSIDSFVRAMWTWQYSTGAYSSAAGYLSAVAKVILAAGCGVVVRACVKGRAYVSESGAALNSVGPLLIAMTLLYPLVWEHHAVFLVLPFLVILKRLSSVRDWAILGFAYFLEFLLPTFDFFPWSYGRLLAPLVVLWLTYSIAGRGNAPAAITPLEKWLDDMPTPRATSR